MIEHIRVAEITQDLAKVAEAIHMSSDEWRETLTPEQHVAREIALGKKLLQHGMPTRHWAVELFNPRRQRWEVVSSMEAVERPAILKLKGERPIATVNYVIDAVFTPKEHRGKGYAKLMLTEVIKQLEEAVSPALSQSVDSKALAKSLITLWSDVGNYYCRFGFQAAHNSCVIESAGRAEYNAAWPNDEQCAPLDLAQSQAAIDYHRAMMVGAIDVMCEKDAQPRAIVTPTVGILDQMQWRAKFVSQCLQVSLPKVHGARTPNGWAAWSYMMCERKLYILAISGPIHEMVTLYKAALAAAADAGNFGVVLYEADLIFTDQALTQYLLDSLKQAGIHFSYGKPDHSVPYYLASGSRSDLKWEFAGRYSWF